MPIAPTLLAAAAVFPIPPDGGAPERLTRAWRTIIATTESGRETRAALRSLALRRSEYTAVFANPAEYLRFRALWLATADGSTQPLRFIVPLWQRQVLATGFTSPTTVTGDFSYRFSDADVARDPRALVWQSETEFELVEIAERSDSAIELVDDLVGTYVPGWALVLPVMNAWLEPPIVSLLSPEAESVPVVFREEVRGLAGADPAVGIARSPEVESVAVVRVAGGSEWAGRKFATYEARAVDAAGIVLEGLPITWNLGDTNIDLETLVITYPNDGRQIHFAYEGGTGSFYRVSATVGGVTSPEV